MTAFPSVPLERQAPRNVCRRFPGRPASAPSGTKGTKASRGSLELLVIWSYVGLSFAALFFVLYVIWAKCEGNWPRLIQGQAGGLLRLGYNMPDDFGPSLVRGMGFMPPPRRDVQSQSSDWGFSVYGGSDANVVLREEFEGQEKYSKFGSLAFSYFF